MASSVLSDVQTALAALGVPVFYGAVDTLSPEEVWDYVVFFRRNLSPTGGKTGIAQTYEVALVFEEYVPDEKVWACVDAMTALPGFRLADTGGEYQYTKKPSTEQVIEILTLDFVRPLKRCPDV